MKEIINITLTGLLRNLAFLLFGIFTTIIAFALYLNQFGLYTILGTFDEYLKIVLTSWPAAILIISVVVLVKHHAAIDYFIRNRMTEVGPGGLKGQIQVERATKEAVEDKIDQEEGYATRIQNEVLSQIKIEDGVAPRIPNTENEQVINRFNKVLGIESKIQTLLREKYGTLYRPEVRLSRGGKEIIVDGLIYSRKNKIHAAVEIKYFSSKSFDALKFIISRRRTKLVSLGIKRLYVILVSNDLSDEEALKIYSENLHQAQIFFYVLKNEELTEINIPNRKDEIL